MAEVGVDAALVAYGNVAGVSMQALTGATDSADGPPGTLTDAQLRGVWDVFRRLQARQIAHRGLTPENILFADDGRAYVTMLGPGQSTPAPSRS